MSLFEIFVLAIGSMFWPLLLVVVVIALNTSRPLSILGWFYLGGLLTSVAVGAVMVFVLQGSSLMSGPRLPSAPWIDVVAGGVALVGALILHRVDRRRKESTAAPRERSRTSQRIEDLVEHGGPLGFVGGILGTLLPGPLVVIGMAGIAQLGYGTAATVVVIVAFFLVMFTLVEVPLVGLVVAPGWTRATVAPFNAWLGRNLVRLAVWALALLGAVEVVRGIVTIVRR